MAEEHGICQMCDEEVDVKDGEMVVIDRTYVDHMLVSEDQEFVCGNCIDQAQEAEVDRALESRYWSGYHEFRSRYG